MSQLPRVLFILPDVVLDFPRALSAHCEGDVLAIWLRGRTASAAEDRALIEGSFGRFRFQPILPTRLPPGLRHVWELARFIGDGLRLSREHGPYDAIVCYSPYRTAMAGLVLRALTGTPLVVEFPQDPVNVYRHVGGRAARVKHWFSPRLARRVAHAADRAVELFPGQLDALLGDDPVPLSVVPPFTRLSQVPRDVPRDRRSVVLLGYPPHLKGVDVLLRAFRQVVQACPDAVLSIAGTPDMPEDLVRMAAGLPVRFLGRLGHDDALRLVASAGVFTLPSRTEGVPRVLIEAMAAGTCVVASDVGGIPWLVRDGETGFVVPVGDADTLADRLIRVLSDDALAERMSQAARRRARAEFSEEVVARGWAEAIHAAGGRTGRTGRTGRVPAAAGAR